MPQRNLRNFEGCLGRLRAIKILREIRHIWSVTINQLQIRFFIVDIQNIHT